MQAIMEVCVLCYGMMNESNWLWCMACFNVIVCTPLSFVCEMSIDFYVWFGMYALNILVLTCMCPSWWLHFHNYRAIVHIGWAGTEVWNNISNIGMVCISWRGLGVRLAYGEENEVH